MQPTLCRLTRRTLVQAAAVVLACTSVSGAPQESRSAAVAKELVQALEAAKLEGIAAADPSSPNSFVAAIYIPGIQLLVVSAQYAAPSLLMEKIKGGDYRGVYMDLHAAGVAGTRIFVQDLGSDGLLWKSGDNVDSWEASGKTLSFDGDWKKSKMSEADYTKAYTDDDDRYAKMLSLLLAGTRQAKNKS
jgi:hypothetical protein